MRRRSAQPPAPLSTAAVPPSVVPAPLLLPPPASPAGLLGPASLLPALLSAAPPLLEPLPVSAPLVASRLAPPPSTGPTPAPASGHPLGSHVQVNSLALAH
jgi:hypothetical protein